MDICIRSAIPSEAKSVSDFLKKHFQTGNPMELAYIYKQNDHKKDERLQDDKPSGFVLSAITEEHVLVAFEMSTKTLVGVLISDIVDLKSKGHLIQPTSSSSCGDKNRAYTDIGNFLAYINAKANVAHRFDVDKYFHFEIIGVHQDYRGQRIAEKLFAAGMDLAKSEGCELVSADCVNVYASKVTEKLGMECVSCVSYDEYNNHLGKCLFVPIPPHTEIKTFVKRV